MSVQATPRSLGLGALLGQAIAAYRARFLLFFLATAVAQLPMLLPTLLFGFGTSSTVDTMLETKLPEITTLEQGLSGLLAVGGDRALFFAFLLVVSSVLSVIGTVLSSGALAYLLVAQRGGVGAVGRAYRVVFSRLLPLFGSMLLAGFIICAVLLLVLVILVFLLAAQHLLAPAGAAPSAGVQLGAELLVVGLVLGGLIWAVYAIVRWALFAQAIVLEDAGPSVALRRSASLLRRHWWRAAALLTVLAIGQIGLGLLASFALGYALQSVGGAIAGLAGSLAWTVVNLVYFPVAANALTLFYLALRAREDLDAQPVTDQLRPA